MCKAREHFGVHPPVPQRDHPIIDEGVVSAALIREDQADALATQRGSGQLRAAWFLHMFTGMGFLRAE